MKIVKETETKTYRYSENCLDKILIKQNEQYYYDSEEEKNRHKAEMEKLGYEDSEQVYENIGSYFKPNFVLFGSYCKFEINTKSAIH